MLHTRCIWTLATSHALVHDNHVHHCSSHALDFDAYTSSSVAWNNLCEENGQEGIFLEETAHACTLMVRATHDILSRDPWSQNAADRPMCLPPEQHL